MQTGNFNDSELHVLLNSPREICQDPYMLLTAFLLDNIKMLVCPDEEDGEIWGKVIPKKMWDKYFVDCVKDFRDAFINDLAIRINGQGFTIRKGNTIDYNKVQNILNFRTEGDDYVIEKTGILDIKTDFLNDYDKKQEEYRKDKTYLYKIIKTVTENKSGWDDLTDIEAAVYCWAVWSRKQPMYNIVNEEFIKRWWDEQYEYFQIPLKEIKECLRKGILDTGKNNTFFIFSSRRIEEWNGKNKQSSIMDQISDDDAETFWFSTGSMKFKRKL